MSINQSLSFIQYKNFHLTMSLIFVRLLLFVLLLKNGLGQSRVNQGREIDLEDAPYMARVRIKVSPDNGGACDGSILSDMFILTAGHCKFDLFRFFVIFLLIYTAGVTDESNINVKNPPLHGPSNFSILIGTSDLDNGEGEVYTVSKVFFREYSSKNDMAILKLSSRIMLDGITKRAVTLPNSMQYSPKNRTSCYVDGWGANPQNSDKLLRADIYTISLEECNTGADAGRDRTYQICTRGDNGAGPCQVSMPEINSKSGLESN